MGSLGEGLVQSFCTQLQTTVKCFNPNMRKSAWLFSLGKGGYFINSEANGRQKCHVMLYILLQHESAGAVLCQCLLTITMIIKT